MEKLLKRKTEKLRESRAGNYKALLLGNTSFSGNGTIYGIAEDETPLGAALVYPDMDHLTLGFIHVSENYRRQHIGESLINAVIEENRGKGLILEAGLMSTQTEAQAFFQALGFGLAEGEDVYGIAVESLRKDWESAPVNMGGAGGCLRYAELTLTQKSAVKRFLQENDPGMESLLDGYLSQELSMAGIGKKGEVLALMLCSVIGEDIHIDYFGTSKNGGAALMRLAGYFIDTLVSDARYANRTYYFVNQGKGIRQFFEGRFGRTYFPAYQLMTAFREL